MIEFCEDNSEGAYEDLLNKIEVRNGCGLLCLVLGNCFY